MTDETKRGAVGNYLRAGFNRAVYAFWDYSDQLDKLRKIEDEEEATKTLNDMADPFCRQVPQRRSDLVGVSQAEFSLHAFEHHRVVGEGDGALSRAGNSAVRS